MLPRRLPTLTIASLVRVDVSAASVYSPVNLRCDMCARESESSSAYIPR